MKNFHIVGICVGILAFVPRLLHYYTGALDTVDFRQLDVIELSIIYLATPIAVYIGKVKWEGEVYFFQNAFKSGIIMVAMAAVTLGVMMYIYYSFIDHAIVTTMVEEAIELAKTEGIPQKEIDERVEGIKSFFSPFLQATVKIMFGLVGGAFFSLLSAVALGKFPR